MALDGSGSGRSLIEWRIEWLPAVDDRHTDFELGKIQQAMWIRFFWNWLSFPLQIISFVRFQWVHLQTAASRQRVPTPRLCGYYPMWVEFIWQAWVEHSGCLDSRMITSKTVNFEILSIPCLKLIVFKWRITSHWSVRHWWSWMAVIQISNGIWRKDTKSNIDSRACGVS